MRISDLLGKRHSIGAAERTFRLMKEAAAEGNLRLAVSRGITVIIQATSAALRAPTPIVRRAEMLIQATRNIIHGAVLKRVALSGMRHPQREDPFKVLKRTILKKEKEGEKAQKKEEEEEKETLKEEAKRLHIMTMDFPALRQTLSERLTYGRIPGGTFIPTPGDPYGIKLRHFVLPLLVGEDVERSIVSEPEGIRVYGEEMVKSVIETMLTLYKTAPWIRGTFIPTPGDQGGERLMSLLRATAEADPVLLNPSFLNKIESYPEGLKVYGPEASEAVSRALTQIKRDVPWTRITVLGSYPLPLGA